MKRTIMLASLATLFISCAEAMDHDDLEMETRSQEVIVHSENWEPMDLENPGAVDTEVRTSARAVFRYNNSCTGFLIGDEFAVTNWHCVEDDWYSTVGRRAQFDPSNTASSFLRKRLYQLGIPFSFTDKFSTNSSACRHWEEFYTSWKVDQAILRCPPIQTNNARVPLGAIWGHANVSVLPFAVNESVATISVNRRTFEQNGPREVLWAPGMIHNINPWYVAPWLTNKFEHTSDTLPGSSGSPVFSRSTRTVKGVNFGNNTFKNYGNLFPSRIKAYRDRAPVIEPLPYTNKSRGTSWIGNTNGGRLNVLTCPVNYAIVGILGDTYEYSKGPDGNLGNFGIICAPYVGRYDLRPLLQTQHYQVRTRGSYNNNFTGYSGDYNTYRLRNPDSNEFHCAAGTYLTRIGAHAHSKGIGKLSKIECLRPSRGSYNPRTNLDRENDMGRLSSGPLEYTTCYTADNKKRIANQVYIRNGWYTDAISLRCNEVN